jgi:DNA topoisomerase-1
VFLMDRTLIRVGNREYAERNGSFGLTTLRDRHVDFSGRRCTFQFRGKGGKDHVVEIEDKRLARIVRRCRDVPGQTLFQYYAEDGSRCSVGSSDVNSFIREATQESFTAKDFRTWGASVIAFEEMARRAGEKGRTSLKSVIEPVAEALGNTPAISRQSYVHPDIIEAASDAGALERRKLPRRTKYLSAAERGLIEFLDSLGCAPTTRDGRDRTERPAGKERSADA